MNKSKSEDGLQNWDTILVPTRCEFTYRNILKDIRDMNVLSNYQLYYLRTPQVSRSKLLEIIELYNFIMQNINDFM